jgi:hypothetical protein
MSDAAFAILSHLVEERTGIHYGARDREIFLEKVRLRAREAGFESLLDYYYLLRYDDPNGVEIDALVDTLVVGETYLFREEEPMRVAIQQCSLHVSESRDGAHIAPGEVVIARAGVHLKIDRAGISARARLDARPTGTPHCPSVDELFASAAESFGARALGVVLTGMGSDGAAGALAIKAVGGRVLTEAASTCVVYGMPRSVVEAGASFASAPLHEMPALILANL